MIQLHTFRKGLVAAAVMVALAGCDSSDDSTTPLPALDDAVEESTEEVVVETTEETTEEVVVDTTEETTEEIVVESTEETTEEISEQTTEEVVVETTEETTEEVTEGVTEEVVVDAPEETIDAEPAFPTGLIDGVSVGQASGTYSLGSPPAVVGSLTLNPLDVESQPVSIISGGSAEIQVSADDAFSTVYVISDDGGFFTVQLPEAVTTSALVVNFSTIQQDGGDAQIGVQVANGEGEISSPQDLDLTSVVVGTGDVQVSVSWVTDTDVDLYLVEPDGTQIDFADPSSDSGGELDLDSNPACFIDGVNNENITYDGVVPPSGEYIVSVDYYSNCGVEVAIRYIVTTRVDGVVTTFDGTFVPSDVNEVPREIARFNFR